MPSNRRGEPVVVPAMRYLRQADMAERVMSGVVRKLAPHGLSPEREILDESGRGTGSWLQS